MAFYSESVDRAGWPILPEVEKKLKMAIFTVVLVFKNNRRENWFLQRLETAVRMVVNTFLVLCDAILTAHGVSGEPPREFLQRMY